MKLTSLNRYISLFFLMILFLPANAEEEIDIWNKKKSNNLEIKKSNDEISNKKIATIKINPNKSSLSIVLTIVAPTPGCRLYLSCIVKKYI